MAISVFSKFFTCRLKITRPETTRCESETQKNRKLRLGVKHLATAWLNTLLKSAPNKNPEMDVIFFCATRQVHTSTFFRWTGNTKSLVRKQFDMCYILMADDVYMCVQAGECWESGLKTDNKLNNLVFRPCWISVMPPKEPPFDLLTRHASFPSSGWFSPSVIHTALTHFCSTLPLAPPTLLPI